MNVENRCVEIEEDMNVQVTQSTSRLNAVRVTHASFTLEIEVTDEHVLIHNIIVMPTHQGIGSALATIICNWAVSEEIGVVALNVLPDAEDWWVAQGFYRKNENNDLHYFPTGCEDVGDDLPSDKYCDTH